MVTNNLTPDPRDGDEAYYDDLQERWPAERPSRKRRRPATPPPRETGKRSYQRKDRRVVTVRSERLDPPDTARLAHALLSAQRDLARAQAEAQARAERRPETPAKEDQ